MPQTNFQPWFEGCLHTEYRNALIPDVKHFLPWQCYKKAHHRNDAARYIRVSVRSTPSGHRESTCLHWKFLPRLVVDTQHHMLPALAELDHAVRRLKMRKCEDDVGLTAVVLKHAPTKLGEHLLQPYNDILYHGAVPRSWFWILFNILLKMMRPKQIADFTSKAYIPLGQNWLGCMFTAAGTQLQHIDLEYHLQQVSNFFTQTGRFYWTVVYPFLNAKGISMPWFHLWHVLAAGTGQFTTPSWLLWMFNVKIMQINRWTAARSWLECGWEWGTSCMEWTGQ